MDTAHTSQQLRGLPTLVKALAKDRTRKFKVSPAGRLAVLEPAGWTAAPSRLDVDAVRGLSEEIASGLRPALLGPWYLTVLRSADGLTIYGERRLGLPDHPIEAPVRAEVLQQARAGRTGLIAGAAGCGKSSILLWLAAQLGRRDLVFVSDRPPRDILAPTATHVFPPASPGERRDLKRFIEFHDCLFWDKISQPADLATFGGAAENHGRWFTVDAATPAALGDRLRFLLGSATPLELDACVFSEVGPEGVLQHTSLGRREGTSWVELLAGDSTTVDILESVAGLGGSSAAASPAPSGPSADTPPPETGRRARKPSPMAGIVSPQRAGRSQSDVSQESAARPAASRQRSSAGQSGADDSTGESTDEPTEGAPGEARGISVTDLIESDEIDRQELIRQSGEIDLRAFVKARNERLRGGDQAEPGCLPKPAPSDPEQDVSEVGAVDSCATQMVAGDQVDAMLDEMNHDDQDPLGPRFLGVDPDKLTPPVRGETTALTPVDMDRIRESAHDDLAWLLGDRSNEADGDDDSTNPDQHVPRAVSDRHDQPPHPHLEADRTPTNELSPRDRQGGQGRDE